MFRNELKKEIKDVSDQDTPIFSLSVFSLLLFDEAHHAAEKHPYNSLNFTLFY